MMGNEMLEAPIVSEKDERDVVLPPGDWYYQNKKWKGGKTYHINVSLNELPVFTKGRVQKINTI